MSTTMKSRKPRTKLSTREKAENFGRMLLMGHPKYLIITREKKTGGLKVTLAKADKHVVAVDLTAKIKQGHPEVQILQPSDPQAVSFHAPSRYEFQDVYDLLYAVAR